MNSQILRIGIAGALAFLTTGASAILAMNGNTIPVELGYVNVASLAFLFGTVTNGSGLTGK